MLFRYPFLNSSYKHKKDQYLRSLNSSSWAVQSEVVTARRYSRNPGDTIISTDRRSVETDLLVAEMRVLETVFELAVERVESCRDFCIKVLF